MAQANFESFYQLEDEVKQEFYQDVIASIKDINQCAELLESGADTQVIDRMFRALHTVKGNCNMVFLADFVDASHKLEDLFSQIRSGQIEYHDSYGRFALIAVNLLKDELDALLTSQSVNLGYLENLKNIITEILQTDESERLEATEKAIVAVKEGHFNLAMVAIEQGHGHSFSFVNATDSEFFEFICDKFCQTDPTHWLFFTISSRLAHQLNDLLNNKMEDQQLNACLCLVSLSRSIGCTADPDGISLDQVFFSSGILNRMAGWSIAADAILMVKEHYGGGGVPYGLSGEQIHPAAQALALAVEFAGAVLQLQHEGYKKSLFNAVKVINAKKNTRYKAKLIERFNQLMKSDYLTQQLW